MRIQLTLDAGQTATDCLVDADDGAGSDALLAALRQVGGLEDDLSLVVPVKSGLVASAPDGTVAGLGLRHGVRLGSPESAPTGQPPATGLELHLVGGLTSGLIFSLPPGEHEIGRGSEISWPDDLLSRRHARLSVEADTVSLTDLESSNGTYVDGRRLEAGDTVELAPGALLGIGTAGLMIVAARPPDAALEPGEPGWLNFLRPPRIAVAADQLTVDVPIAPTEPAKRRFPIAALIAPLILGVVMVLMMHNLRYALFMVLSPMMMVFNFISDRRGGRADYKTALAKYHADLATAQANLAAAIQGEKARLRADWPDAADTWLTCVLPGHRLWERRPGDPDSLAIRLGTADLPSTIKVTGGADGADHRLTDVPVGVRLRDQPVLGLAGPPEPVDAVLRWVVAQLAAYHPTRDLTCSFIGLDTADDWSWLQWLPHLRPDPADAGPLAYVYTRPKPAADHVTALAGMVQSRRAALGHDHSGVSPVFPAHVLIIRGYNAVRGLPGMSTILADGPAVGVFAVCTDRDEKTLPEECAATFVFGTGIRPSATLRRRDQPSLVDVRVDGVTPAWCDGLARELSPLVDIGGDDQANALPAAARLLDVLGLDPPTPAAIQVEWARGGRTTRAVIGQAADGPFAIDIRRDGPHGLVAGTTGSGKSELLQTLVAALAVANRPDEMNFVLIDYKGGAAFKDCADLPHTVGMVSDLDGHLTNRALASLSAELRRRERQLAQAGTKDIEDYLAAKLPGDEPMPRLLIIIDEFAALIQELPEFVTGLIDIARRGRSLGTHLILATQRPAGVVSAEIRSNTNLRIALRVTDAGDSADVIDAPDAAHIPKSLPGRAFARLGHSSLYAFQSARVGGRPPGAVAAGVPSVWAYGVDDLAAAAPARSVDEADDAGVPTDLATLVRAVGQATTALGLAARPSPWLPPLDPVIGLDQVLAEFPEATPSESRLVVPLGLTDLPSQQRRDVAIWDIAHGSHLAVIGTGRSGRSTVLRLVGGAIGAYLSPADVHIYGVDCGNNALLPLAGLPHVGAVVSRDQADRLDRLTTLISQTIATRQQSLAAGGFADIAEQRAAAPVGAGLPYIVILFDSWEGFFQVYDGHDAGRLVAAWQQILQEGAAVGLRVIMTGDLAMVSGRMAALFPDRLMLKMLDPSDYTLIGLSSRDVPSAMPAGRGFRSAGIVETQVAVLDADPAGTAQVAALQRIARDATQRWGGLPVDQRPKRVDILPSRFTISQVAALGVAELAVTALPVAVGGDTLGLRTLDAIEHGPALLVTGPRRSGRSTVLRTMATFAARADWQIVTITPRVSPLRQLPVSDQVFGPFDLKAGEAELTEMLERVRAGSAPSLVLVDDIAMLGADGWLPRLLVDHIERIRDSGSLLVGAGSSVDLGTLYSGPVAILKKARSGVMLAPLSTVDSELFGVTLQRSALGQAMPPGGGYLVQAGNVERVQVIWPDPDEASG